MSARSPNEVKGIKPGRLRFSSKPHTRLSGKRQVAARPSGSNQMTTSRHRVYYRSPESWSLVASRGNEPTGGALGLAGLFKPSLSSIVICSRQSGLKEFISRGTPPEEAATGRVFHDAFESERFHWERYHALVVSLGGSVS